MKTKREFFVISLGGSLIVPEGIDTDFLKQLRSLILNQIKKGRRFIIITGGGKTARNYQNAASEIAYLHREDLDWLGIHSTRLNAHLLRTIFRNVSHPAVIKNPTKPVRTKKPVIIAAGWKPGCSTDYDAVLLAGRFKAKTILNLSNIDYVYTSDPKKDNSAEPIEKISWKEFRKIVGNKWEPGLNAPFDPVASREAQKLGLKVVIMNGRDFKNIENFLSGKKFKGTVIE
ncbi:MAG: UMP kinase [Candidatus Aenigmatarchaeota archaeon]